MKTYSNEAKTFLSRLTKITEANLSNDQFGVTELARETGMKLLEILGENEASRVQINIAIKLNDTSLFLD